MSVGLARMVWAQTAMELGLAFSRAESLLITAVMPLVLLVFFASVPVLPIPGERAIDFLLPGILALAIISTSMVSLGIATAFERYYGVLKRLGGSPLPRSGLLAAKILSVLIFEIGQAGVLVLVAVVLFGWRPTGGFLFAPIVLLLGTLSFSALGLLMAGALRAEATLAAANGLYLVFLLLGDMLVPLDRLPPWLAAVARLLPAAALAEALRASFQTVGAEVGASLLVLLGWGVVFLLGAARTFRWE